jgi:hypothetical protein
MKLRVAGLFSQIVAGVFLTLPVTAKSPIEEIADASLPDIAAVHHEPGKSPVILYNPILCKQAGPALCEFYRYHEYGHIAMRHHQRSDMSAQQKEQEADRWAAQRAPLRSILAAWQYFSSGGGSTPVHGDGPTRAARLTEGWISNSQNSQSRHSAPGTRLHALAL